MAEPKRGAQIELSTGSLSGPQLAACYVLMGLLALSPLCWATVPPLADYPGYLGRMAVLAAPDASASYVVHWQLIPNLAMDLVVPLLSALVGLETAGRLFIGATMLLLLAGTALLHRALFGRIGLWPLISLLFLYNFALFFGFLNFLFGLGLALVSFAGWIASHDWRSPVRLAVFTPIAGVLFVCHLFAFGIYSLLVGCFEIGLLLAVSRVTLAAFGRHALMSLQFVPAIIMWLSNPAAGKPHTTVYGDLEYKIIALLAPMNFSVVGWALAPVVAVLFLAAWRWRALRLAPQMRLPILAMIAVAVAMPDLLYGSAWADIRLPIALSFVVIASVQPQVSRIWLSRLVMAAVLALVLARIVAVTLVWCVMDKRFAEFRAVAHNLPAASRVLVARTKMPEEFGRIDGVPEWFAAIDFRNFYHMSDLAVVDRDAFVPTLGLQLAPVQPAPRNLGINGYSYPPLLMPAIIEGVGREPVADPNDDDAGIYFWADWPHRFDYLLIIDFGNRQNPVPEHLKPFAQGSFFTFYKIVPGPTG